MSEYTLFFLALARTAKKPGSNSLNIRQIDIFDRLTV